MSRLTEAKKKYPDLDWDVWQKADPSKNHKYLDWIGTNTIYSYSSITPEQISELLKSFEKNKSKLPVKDITAYDLESLGESLRSIKLSRKQYKGNEIVKVENGLGMDIALLNGLNAVAYYTAGTKWCISAPETFLTYAVQSNIYVATRNKVKLVVLSYLSEKQSQSFNIYTPDDKRQYDNLSPYLRGFLNVESSWTDLRKLSELCHHHAKSNPNIFYRINNSETFPIEDLKKLDPKTMDFLLTNINSINIFRPDYVEWVAVNLAKHPELKPFADFYSSSERMFVGCRKYGRNFRIKDLWALLQDRINGDKNKILIDEITRRIKKGGGVKKIISDEKAMSFFVEYFKLPKDNLLMFDVIEELQV